MKNRFIRIAAAVLAVIWMTVIFSYSSDPAEVSSEVSISVSYQLVDAAQEMLGLNWDSTHIQTVADNIEWAVRKAAHMTEYAILSGLIGVAMYVWRPLDTGVPHPRRKWLILPAVDLLICGIYASSDEFHQTFVYGRTGRVKDVFIDLAGALICLLIVTLIAHVYYSRKRRQSI